MSIKANYIDIHGHVNFPEYDKDREEVIERAQKADVAMISVGTDIATSTSAVQLANSHENIWATVGIHPVVEEKIDVDMLVIEKMAEQNKVVAIGECGLDYFHSKPQEIATQKELFEKHIVLAQKVGKPLMLHVRNGKLAGSVSSIGNAYQDALNILKKYPEVKANFHFFAGNNSDLKDIIECGYSVSFTGVISFTHDYDELIRSTPVTQIMSETDCPYVAPTPHRGKRNEPFYVIKIVKAIARIRGEDEVAVAKQLVENAKNFFRLK